MRSKPTTRNSFLLVIFSLSNILWPFYNKPRFSQYIFQPFSCSTLHPVQERNYNLLVLSRAAWTTWHISHLVRKRLSKVNWNSIVSFLLHPTIILSSTLQHNNMNVDATPLPEVFLAYFSALRSFETSGKIYTRLYGAISQNTAAFTVPAVCTSNLTHSQLFKIR
jgi:hypothetical protein